MDGACCCWRATGCNLRANGCFCGANGCFCGAAVALTAADASEADLAALRELVRQCSRAIKDDAERTALTFEIHETRLAMKLADG